MAALVGRVLASIPAEAARCAIGSTALIRADNKSILVTQELRGHITAARQPLWWRHAFRRVGERSTSEGTPPRHSPPTARIHAPERSTVPATTGRTILAPPVGPGVLRRSTAGNQAAARSTTARSRFVKSRAPQCRAGPSRCRGRNRIDSRYRGLLQGRNGLRQQQTFQPRKHRASPPLH